MNNILLHYTISAIHVNLWKSWLKIYLLLEDRTGYQLILARDKGIGFDRTKSELRVHEIFFFDSQTTV